MNYKQVKAIEKRNKERILACNPRVPEYSGIYILTRQEDGFKYAYVGQAVNILQRLAGHLNGYQYIELSMKKHGLFSEEKNPTGWKIDFVLCDKHTLDEWEQYYIKKAADAGYQLRNVTSGSQGEGKKIIAEAKPARGYHDGLAQGRKNCQREIAHWFKLYLTYDIKEGKKEHVNAKRAYDKFTELLNEEVQNGSSDDSGNG